MEEKSSNNSATIVFLLSSKKLLVIWKNGQDINMKGNTEDYLKRIKPIPVALDKVKGDICKINDAVDVWNG